MKSFELMQISSASFNFNVDLFIQIENISDGCENVELKVCLSGKKEKQIKKNVEKVFFYSIKVLKVFCGYYIFNLCFIFICCLPSEL